MSSDCLSQSLVESGKWVYVENNAKTIGNIPRSFSADSTDEMVIRNIEAFRAADSADDIHVDDHDNIKKPDANSSAIPDDFICPISLELMRDPVIVATGQVCMLKMLSFIRLVLFFVHLNSGVFLFMV